MKTEDLVREIDRLKPIYLHRLFQHYKGGVYKIIGIVFDSSSDEFALRYERVAGPHFNEANEAGIEFTRTVRDFEMKVLGTNNVIVPRFVHVAPRATTVYVPIVNPAIG